MTSAVGVRVLRACFVRVLPVVAVAWASGPLGGAAAFADSATGTAVGSASVQSTRRDQGPRGDAQPASAYCQVPVLSQTQARSMDDDSLAESTSCEPEGTASLMGAAAAGSTDNENRKDRTGDSIDPVRPHYGRPGRG